MAWKFVEGLTVADVAFEASGKTLAELFESAAQATTATMVKRVSSVKAVKTRKFSLKEEDSVEKLLFEFLQKLVFYKDADVLLFSKYSAKITESKKGGSFKLDAVVKGDKINPKTQQLLVDVKAVTWHKFEVIKTSRGTWKATVILDV